MDVDAYPHGTPSWIDLATPDPEASRAFYGALFGWDFEDSPTDRPGVPYTMCSLRGRATAGMMLLAPEMAAGGMPPCWTSYISVDDLEAAVAKVAPAGGTVLQPPMDVMDAGRMAVLSDPTGAVVALWEAKDHVGAEIVNEHAALCWNELMTSDVSAAIAFYGEVLGWTSETAPMDGGDYTLFHRAGGDESGIAGSMALPMEGMPSAWGVYFAVDDCEATVAQAAELGAQVVMPATQMDGVGTFAAMADPQGAFFSVMQPEST